MIDSVVKNAVEAATRFLAPGHRQELTVNDHDIVIIALGTTAPRSYVVGCTTCARWVTDRNPAPFKAIHDHTKPDEEPARG